jgi:hypothetical protein
MKFEITSEVIIDGIGKVKHDHEQDFAENSNVFGRVLEYRTYMRNTFPNCEFRLICAKQKKEG